MSSLPSVYQDVIGLSRYARYLPEQNRRELWSETVDRLVKYLTDLKLQDIKELEEIRQAVL